MSIGRRVTQIVVLLVTVSLLLVSGTGCSRKQAAQKPANRMKIGVSLASTREGTGQVLKKMMEDAAKQEKVDLVFQDAKNDAVEQEKGIDKLLEEKVKAVILQPVDPVAAKSLVEKLTARQVKVIAVDKLPVDTYLDGFIGPDYTRIGEIQAEFAANAINSGSVVILQGDQNDPAAVEITEANLARLQDFPQIKVLAVHDHPGWNATLAERSTSETLDSFPALSGILANDSTLALAAGKVLKEQQLAGKVVVVGTGIDRKAAAALQSGELTADVDKVPDMIAAAAVRAAAQVAKGQTWDYTEKIVNGTAEIPARITPVRLITKENMALVEPMVGKIQENTGGGDSGGSSDSGGGGSDQGGAGGEEGKSMDMETEVKKTKDEIMIRIKNVPEGQGGEGGGGSGDGGAGGGSDGS